MTWWQSEQWGEAAWAELWGCVLRTAQSLLLGSYRAEGSRPTSCIWSCWLSSAAVCFSFADVCSSCTSAAHHVQKLYYFFFYLWAAVRCRNPSGEREQDGLGFGRVVVTTGKTCRDRITGGEQRVQRALGCKGTPCFPVLRSSGCVSAGPDCARSPAVGQHLPGMAAITANEFQVFTLSCLSGGAAQHCPAAYAGQTPKLFAGLLRGAAS